GRPTRPHSRQTPKTSLRHEELHGNPRQGARFHMKGGTHRRRIPPYESIPAVGTVPSASVQRYQYRNGTFAFVDRTNDADRFDIRDADHLFAIGIAYARKRCFPVGTTTHIDYE